MIFIFMLMTLIPSAQGSTDDRPRIIALSTTNCGPCKQFTADAAREPLKKALSKFKLIKYGDAEPVKRSKYLTKYSIKYYPAFVLERSDGTAYKILRGYTLSGLLRELK